MQGHCAVDSSWARLEGPALASPRGRSGGFRTPPNRAGSLPRSPWPRVVAPLFVARRFIGSGVGAKVRPDRKLAGLAVRAQPFLFAAKELMEGGVASFGLLGFRSH